MCLRHRSDCVDTGDLNSTIWMEIKPVTKLKTRPREILTCKQKGLQKMKVQTWRGWSQESPARLKKQGMNG